MSEIKKECISMSDFIARVMCEFPIAHSFKKPISNQIKAQQPWINELFSFAALPSDGYRNKDAAAAAAAAAVEWWVVFYRRRPNGGRACAPIHDLEISMRAAQYTRSSSSWEKVLEGNSCLLV